MELRSDGRIHNKPPHLLGNVLETKGNAGSIERESRQAVESSVEVIPVVPTAGNSSGVECSCHITLFSANLLSQMPRFSQVLKFLPR